MNVLINYIDSLAKYINYNDLPGEKAHLKMMPETRRKEFKKFSHKVKAIKSSVLILLFPIEGKLNTALILRPEYDGVHSGQVAFPGGKKEKDDKDLLETAKREAYEEIGVRTDIYILGTLTQLYIPPSNYNVLPVVGYIDRKPNFIADKKEVAEIIEVGLEDFYNGNIAVQNSLFNVVDGMQIEAPCFKIKNHLVWGATAMIISEFVEILKSARIYN